MFRIFWSASWYVLSPLVMVEFDAVFLGCFNVCENCLCVSVFCCFTAEI